MLRDTDRDGDGSVSYVELCQYRQVRKLEQAKQFIEVRDVHTFVTPLARTTGGHPQPEPDSLARLPCVSLRAGKAPD